MLTRFAAALFACLPLSAIAQEPPCGDRETILAELAVDWGEVRQSIALDWRGPMVEVVANLETGSWTLIITPPGGASCVIAHGWNYEATDDALPPAGVPG